jgi:hypothetical protein
MRLSIPKRRFGKFGKKALLIYLCWCLLKGLAFLFLGFRLFN